MMKFQEGFPTEVEDILPEDVCNLIDDCLIYLGLSDGFKNGDKFLLKYSFISVLNMILKSHGIRHNFQGKLPKECRNQIGRVILLNLEENICLYPV